MRFLLLCFSLVFMVPNVYGDGSDHRIKSCVVLTNAEEFPDTAFFYVSDVVLNGTNVDLLSNGECVYVNPISPNPIKLPIYWVQKEKLSAIVYDIELELGRKYQPLFAIIKWYENPIRLKLRKTTSGFVVEQLYDDNK